MPLTAWTPLSTYAPAKTADVWHDPTDEWLPVKKMKSWVDGAWVLTWVHPVVDATLSQSKTGVATGEAYNVTLSVPGGFPEGAAVTFRFTGYSWTTNPAEGATTATLPGATHAASGTYAWYADVVTKGGNTTFGPLTQTAGSALTTTIAMTAPTWVLSGNSGAFVNAVPGTFDITLGTPSAVSKVSFQVSYAGGAWTEYKSWTSPVAASLSHSMIFYTAGAWKARAVVTLTNATVLYSAEKALTCYLRTIAMTASDTTPITGDLVTLKATFTGTGPPVVNARWQYMNLAGSTWVEWATDNPHVWNTPVVANYKFRWIESHPDGSWVSSNEVTCTVAEDAVVVNGGHCHNIQAGMDSAKSLGKSLRLTGTFLVYTNVEIPANLSINATGAKFNCNRDTGTYVRPGDAHNSGKFVNGGSGGAYNRAGWFNWNGGTFDGNGESCFTISHSPGFTIRNATMYRYCANQDYFSWGDGHAIEINSSGGADNGSGVNGTFNVLISNITLQGTDMGQRAWGNDEPIHYDWSWEGSGGASPWDGTMSHNVRVTGCTFTKFATGATVSGAGHNGYNSWTWKAAICAIGGHDPSQASKDGMADGSLDPSGGWNTSTDRPLTRHNHFKFDANKIYGSPGYAGNQLRFDKGAIHAHRLRQVWTINNNFYGCGPHQVSGWASDDIPTYGSVSGNTSDNGGAPNTYWVANS